MEDNGNPLITIRMSETITKLAPALVEAQATIGSAHKGASNPFYKKKYADLAEVIQTCKEALNANGIAFLQPILTGSKGVCVSTMLLHESGEWMEATVDFPVAKVDSQEYGKAVSYARRYSLQAFLSIPAEDDDGNTASNKGTPSTMAKALTQDFPEGEWLEGVLEKVLPAAGTMPTQAFLQTENGTMQFSTFLPLAFLEQRTGEPVKFQYGRQGKLRVVTQLEILGHEDMTPPSAPAPLPLQAPHGEYQKPQTRLETERDLLDEANDGDQQVLNLTGTGKDGEAGIANDGEPAEENYFAPDTDTIATLVNFSERETKTGKYVCDLIFSCADGQIPVTAWDKPGKWHVSWSELLDHKVYFRASEGKMYQGKRQYTLQDICHYPLKATTEGER